MSRGPSSEKSILDKLSFRRSKESKDLLERRPDLLQKTKDSSGLDEPAFDVEDEEWDRVDPASEAANELDEDYAKVRKIFQAEEDARVEAAKDIMKPQAATESPGDYSGLDGPKFDESDTKFSDVLDEEDKEKISEAIAAPSLFDRIENWLERTPFIANGDFNFWKQYQVAVNELLLNRMTVFQRKKRRPKFLK